MAEGTTIGKAYVKIMPSMEGMKKMLLDMLNKDAGDAGAQSGKAIGDGIVGTLKSTIGGLIAAAGIGKIISDSFMEGADLEQQIGGVETLFKVSADTVVKYANNAYKTAGMSANEYMSLATSFSATLLQGLGNDTAAAAEYANMAMTDMSDNANKMGTDMELITNAYQGFAKDNYDMLDNLKLGYGGTQSEMARLINDSGVLGDSVEVTAETVKDVPFDKIVQAIHEIQTRLGITGTTAAEASETFSGSFNAMKAAAENFLAAFMMNGKDGVNVTPALQNLLDSTSTFVFGNALPAVGRMITSLITIIPQLIIQGIPQLKTSFSSYFASILPMISSFFTQFPVFLQAYMPILMQSGFSLFQNLINGFLQAIPFLTTYIGSFVTSIINVLMVSYPQFIQQGTQLVSQLITGLSQSTPVILETLSAILQQLIVLLVNSLPDWLAAGLDMCAELINALLEQSPNIVSTLGDILVAMIQEIMKKFPDFLQKGLDIIQKLIDGIVKNGPAIVASIVTTLVDLLATIASHFPEFLQKGIELIGKFSGGIIEGIPGLIAQIPGMLSQIASAFLSYDWIGIGADILAGIANGIIGGVTGLVDSAIRACKKLTSSIKSFFGIGSPSKLMKKDVGRWLPAGEAEGIIAGMPVLNRAVSDMNDTVIDGVQSVFADPFKVTTSAAVRSVETGQYFPAADKNEAWEKTVNYGGVTIQITGTNKDPKAIAREVKRILISDEEIERRGRLT